MSTYFTSKHAEDRLLGSYRLLRLLGSGEYAAVYLGEHVYLKTQAAIKVLHTQLAGDELQVFLTEARALAHLVHPHIVRVLDFGVERGVPFLVMDFAPDGTLRQRHQDGVPLTCANVLHYVKQIASALQYAHYQGVIHRDIKPDNILVGRNNEVLLSDFGIAAQAHEAGREKNRRTAEGNCAYMAPEQFAGSPCPASDQYALGIMAYEWLTGGRPFSGGETEMMVQHQSKKPPSLREMCATIPLEVEQVVLRALAKRPEDRFESVEVFAEALARACGATSPVALLPPAPSQAQLAFQYGRAHHQPLVGREREWEALIHLLSSVELEQYPLPSPAPSGPPERDRRTGCALLLGELGIGKTRLAEDLSREAQRRGWAVAWGRSYAQESGLPYAVWVEILQNLLHTSAWRVEEAVPAPLRRFLPLIGSSEQAGSADAVSLPQQERALLWVAVRDLFTKIAQRTPLLVVLDDLHWADESSIELLAYLIRHLAEQRVLFVATYRQTELYHAHPLVALEPALRYEQRAVKFALSPLTEEQIAQLLSGLSPSRVLEIQAQAGGNPFFAEQLASTPGAGNSGHAWERSQVVRSSSGIPATITAALERRVGTLSMQCQQLLSVAAVLRGSFSHRILRGMMRADQQEEGRLLDLLDEAIEAGILVEEGSRTAVSYHFWHPLVVTYLYERLSAIRRVHLHREAAEALLQYYQGREGEGAAAVAFHLVECESSACSIVRYAEMAADHAFRLSAYTEAAFHYHLAVEHLAESLDQNCTAEALSAEERLASLLERLAECRMIQGEFSDAREHYERILQIRAAPIGASPTCPTEAEAVQQASVRVLLWSEIVRALRMQGDYQRGRECCQQARATLAAAGIEDGPALASLGLQQSYIDWQEGHYASARQLALEALRLAEQMGERTPGVSHSSIPTRLARVLGGDALLLGELHELLSNIASSEGQMGDALAHLAIALGLYEQLEDPRAIAHVTGNLGYTYLMRGEDELSRMHLSRSFALAEQVGDRAVMSVAALNLGELAARSGGLQEAETWFKRSLVLTQQAGDRETEVWVRDSLAAAYRDQGKLLDALDCLRGAIRLSRAIENTPCLALALVALGQVRLLQAQAADGAERARFLRRARAEVSRALAFEHLYTEPRTSGRLVLAQVALLEGSLPSAWQEATQALAEAQASDLALLQGRAQRVLGAILAAQGDFELADQHFEQALQMCRSHHMELERARTLHLYAEALLERCVGASGAAMVHYQRALNYLQEARGVCATCHAALDSRQAELALQQAPSKRPFLGWF